ncbi:MAG: family 10 glycosylhydrolase [Limnochordaceae bacterium]|nr:family 10 glycosylhydrolase [Limnochordaceae bacterium]
MGVGFRVNRVKAIRKAKTRTIITVLATVVAVGMAMSSVGMERIKVSAATGDQAQQTDEAQLVQQVQQAQQEADQALQAALVRVEQARLKLWSFDEEHVRQVLAEAQQTLADSRAKSSAAGAAAADLEDALTLARQAKWMADGTDVLTLDSRAAEARGVWIDDVILSYMTDPDMLRGMVRRLAQANVNVIYVSTYEMGRTTYPSQYAIQQEKEFKDFEEDPMTVLVDEAHRQGIEVQALLALFSGGFNGQPGPLLQAHPDWADITRSGKKISYYQTTPMNPAYPPAREYLLNIVREVVTRYPVDGIHLDYIRYEDDGADDFGYHPWSIEQFKKEYGVDPRTVSRNSPMGQKWVKWRQDQVTSFVRQVRQLVNQIRPGTLVSAAVFAEPSQEAAQFRFQDWPLWVQEGLLDQVVPMDYQPDLDPYQRFAKEDAAAVRNGQKTYWYQGIGQYGLSDDETARRIQLNRELGADGSVLFSMLYMKMDTYRTLQEGPWRLPAVLPTGRKGATEAAVAAELNRLADRLAAVYPAQASGASASAAPSSGASSAPPAAAAPSASSASPAVLPLVNQLRQVAQLAQAQAQAQGYSQSRGQPDADGQPLAQVSGESAAQPQPAPLVLLQAHVAELQSLLNQPSIGETGVSPVTVGALQTELAYVQHLISLGLSRGD